MKVNIEMINIPGSQADWKLARRASADELPVLTQEQKSIAKDFGISQEDYARSVLGRRYAEVRYRGYAEHFAKLLLKALRSQSAQTVEIIYDVWQEKFHCWLKRNGALVPVSFKAGIVTEPLERGDSNGLRQAQKAVEFGVEQALLAALKSGRTGIAQKRR